MAHYSFKHRSLSEALYLSLLPDPFYQTLEQSVQGNAVQKKEAMLRYMDFSMKEGEQFGHAFTPTAHEYGASIWLKPPRDSEERERKKQKKEFIRAHMGKEPWLCYETIVNYMSLQSSSLVPSDAWYLSIVGLMPDQQNKGLGSGLIRPILDKADQNKVPTYLETFTPKNMSFYERLGYKAASQFEEPITRAAYWVMVRQPQ